MTRAHKERVVGVAASRIVAGGNGEERLDAFEDAVTSPLRPAPPRDLCTDCGVSRLADAKACGRACQFIRPDYAALERRVHGRSRDPERPDEPCFGPFRSMHRAVLGSPRPG